MAGTLAQSFYPCVLGDEWDGTDPAGGDVRKLLDAAPSGESTTTAADFGTSGTKTITLDPFNTRSTTGTDSSFGWAINYSGSDGMESATNARRFVPAGDWSFQGNIFTLVSALSTCTVGVNVYKVAASPGTTRTLLMSGGVNAGTPTSVGVNWSFAIGSQPQIILEAGETLQVTYLLTCTGQLGGLTINMRTGTPPLGGNINSVGMPSPGIRTLRLEDHTLTGRGVPSRGANTLTTTKSLTGKGVPTIARSYVGAKTFSLTGKGVPTRTLEVTKVPRDLAGVGVTGGRVEVPFDEIPDESGSSTAIKPIFLFDD